MSRNQISIIKWMQQNTKKEGQFFKLTTIGNCVGGVGRTGKLRNSSWASPILKKLVDMGIVGQHGLGFYYLTDIGIKYKDDKL